MVPRLFCVLWAGSVAMVMLPACEVRSKDPKMGVIDAVDAALRRGSLKDLTSLALDPQKAAAACPGVTSEHKKVLIERWSNANGKANERAAACLELADWRRARRLALNYGTQSEPAEVDCASTFARLERSELYYAVDDTVFKVNVEAFLLDGRAGLLRPLRCSKKGGTPGDLERLGENCKGHRWSRVTQADGRCP